MSEKRAHRNKVGFSDQIIICGHVPLRRGYHRAIPVPHAAKATVFKMSNTRKLWRFVFLFRPIRMNGRIEILNMCRVDNSDNEVLCIGMPAVFMIFIIVLKRNILCMPNELLLDGIGIANLKLLMWWKYLQ